MSQAAKSRQPVIMHVDMDAFYASIEIAHHPELAKLPVYVGAGERSVVLSANYLARRFGIQAGMPSLRAGRICPQAVAIRPDFESYTKVSRQVMAILSTFTYQAEQASIDEAFLDITGALRRLGHPKEIGRTVKAEIRKQLGINCSIGIGPSKMVAKIASAKAKPNGLVEVKPSGVIAFLHPLKVEAICGVGPATSQRLHQLGLATIDDLAHTPRETLSRALGASTGYWLADLAWGKCQSTIHPSHETERCISSQITFSRDSSEASTIITELLRVSTQTSRRLRAKGLCASQITTIVRLANFTTLSRSGQLASPADTTDEIFQLASRLYQRMHLDNARLRLVGVRAEKLSPSQLTYRQPTLDAPACGMRQAEQASDAAAAKFGEPVVGRARLLMRRA